jgi:hypothetical protein
MFSFFFEEGIAMDRDLNAAINILNMDLIKVWRGTL